MQILGSVGKERGRREPALTKAASAGRWGKKATEARHNSILQLMGRRTTQKQKSRGVKQQRRATLLVYCWLEGRR